MQRKAKIVFVWAVAMLLVVDTASACRIFWRLRCCDPCPVYCTPCPPPCCHDVHPDGSKVTVDKPTIDEDMIPKPDRDEKPTEKKPAAEKVPVDIPDDDQPAEDIKPADDKPVEEKPVEEKPTEEKPSDDADLDNLLNPDGDNSKGAVDDEGADENSPDDKQGSEESTDDATTDDKVAPGRPDDDPDDLKDPLQVRPSEEGGESPDKPIDDDNLDDLLGGDDSDSAPPKDEPEMKEKTESDSLDDLLDGGDDDQSSRGALPHRVQPAAVEKTQVGNLSQLPVRSWNDNTRTFRCHGRLVRVADGYARILKDNGKYCKVPLRRLSRADFRYVQQQAETAGLGVLAFAAQK